MEKAILKTLIYADIFDYPLNIYELHKWLIGRKMTLRQVEKVSGGLVQSAKCKVQSGYYFLPGNHGLVAKRLRRKRQSEKYLTKAKILAVLLKIIPWIKLVGISGGLAMDNATEKDDIDLFIITAKNRLWVSRLLTLGILSVAGQRRKRGEMGKRIAGKICINALLEEDRLEQRDKDIFIAHEVLQMKVLWQRGGIYSRYLMDNQWAFKFLPNWTTSLSSPRMRGSNSEPELFKWIPAFAGMTLERVARWLQLKIMSRPTGMERIEDGALYFHPQDCRLKILSEYKLRVKKL